MICGLRFNGIGVAVGVIVELGSGSGVKVSVRGAIVSVGLSGVPEARSGADVKVAHAEEIRKNVINSMRLICERAESMDDDLNFIE